jgi:hypothetical protein
LAGVAVAIDVGRGAVLVFAGHDLRWAVVLHVGRPQSIQDHPLRAWRLQNPSKALNR